MFVNQRAAKHFAPQAVEEHAIGVELAVEAVAIPDGNAVKLNRLTDLFV